MARATGRPFRPPRELLARLAPRAGKMSLHLSPMGSESSTAPKNSRRSCSRDVGCQGYTDYEIGHSTPLPGVEGHDGDRVPSPAQAFPDALDPIRKSCAPGDSGPSSVTARQFQGTGEFAWHVLCCSNCSRVSGKKYTFTAELRSTEKFTCSFCLSLWNNKFLIQWLRSQGMLSGVGCWPLVPGCSSLWPAGTACPPCP